MFREVLPKFRESEIYHDIESAEVIFSKYDEIKYAIIQLMMRGMKPTELLKENTLNLVII